MINISPVRVEAQLVSLSRKKHGFESRTGCPLDKFKSLKYDEGSTLRRGNDMVLMFILGTFFGASITGLAVRYTIEKAKREQMKSWNEFTSSMERISNKG